MVSPLLYPVCCLSELESSTRHSPAGSFTDYRITSLLVYEGVIVPVYMSSTVTKPINSIVIVSSGKMWHLALLRTLQHYTCWCRLSKGPASSNQEMLSIETRVQLLQMLYQAASAHYFKVERFFFAYFLVLWLLRANITVGVVVVCCLDSFNLKVEGWSRNWDFYLIKHCLVRITLLLNHSVKGEHGFGFAKK